jgi:hypothetical protein
VECDDNEQYLITHIGEIMNKKYKVIHKCGKGAFSNVVKAVDIETNEEVAIKVNIIMIPIYLLDDNQIYEISGGYMGG